MDLDDGSGSLWVFHVLNVLDALADEASVRSRSSTDGHVSMLHERVSLDAELVQGQTIFRLPSPYGLFLSREFVEAWEREGITGTTFGPRWEQRPTGELRRSLNAEIVAKRHEEVEIVQ